MYIYSGIGRRGEHHIIRHFPIHTTFPEFVNMPDAKRNTTASSSEEESSSDDDSLALEGVVARHPDAPSSSDDDDEGEEEPCEPTADETANQKDFGTDKRKGATTRSSKVPPPKRKKSNESETMQVEFTFHDMDDKFFHGLKSLLHNSCTTYQPHSSELVDLMINNIAVGTVLSTQGDTENNVYGFASVLNITEHQQSPAIQQLQRFCLDGCPADRSAELEVVLSGKTKRPAGFVLHGRMLNLPLEIVEVLQQQLVLDMDWAVEHAEGGVDARKALDFGVFLRLAPCQKDNTGALVYRFFDDEVLAGQADFSFLVEAPASYSKEDKNYVSVIVLTKTGHRAAMKDLAKLIHGR